MGYRCAGSGEIPFVWAQFSPRDKTVAGMNVVLCAPEKADADITNAEHLVGKMVAVYRGECTFKEKTERLSAAGAAGVIIINSEDGIFEAPGADKGYSATIPVVMIRAKDAQELFSSGDSSGLKVQLSAKEAEAAVLGSPHHVYLRHQDEARTRRAGSHRPLPLSHVQGSPHTWERGKGESKACCQQQVSGSEVRAGARGLVMPGWPGPFARCRQRGRLSPRTACQGR